MMDLLPNENDAKPQSTRFWVAKREGEITSVVLTESEEKVQERLERDFLLYKLRKIASGVISKLMIGKNDEI